MNIIEQEQIGWNLELLDQMLYKSDDEAEKIISEIAISGDFSSLRGLFEKLNSDKDVAIDSTLPESVINYFNTNNTLPNWADKNKIKIAQDVFAEYGPFISMILMFKSLPLSYSCKNGAKILSETGRMQERGSNTDSVLRRLMQTTQLVINVMSEGGLDESGSGILSVKKVRLYHAAIRFFILNPKYNPNGWDVDEYGAPINQVELAGTLTSFSAMVIEGLTELGVQLSKEQKDAYMHCWSIVGYFIGLDSRLFPVSYEDGKNLAIAILKQNQHESENGKNLIDSLIKNCQNNFFTTKLVDHVPEYITHFFLENISKEVGVDFSKVLGLDQNKPNIFKQAADKLFLNFLEKTLEFEDHSTIVQKITEKYSTEILVKISSHFLQNNKVEFYIPSSLKMKWNMTNC